MIPTETGRRAEAAVADYLAKQGYRILARNWRTRFCEIDIVAERKGVICFVEVKYRTTDKQGGGLEYITAKKLKQMDFAAQSWCNEKDWAGDWRLVAAAVSFDGRDYTVENLVEVS